MSEASKGLREQLIEHLCWVCLGHGVVAPATKMICIEELQQSQSVCEDHDGRRVACRL
jgi:hypothetical protein